MTSDVKGCKSHQLAVLCLVGSISNQGTFCVCVCVCVSASEGNVVVASASNLAISDEFREMVRRDLMYDEFIVLFFCT